MRAVRVIVLIAVALLALPYVIAPFYNFGHPVSALMAWRFVTGAKVERQWRDLAAMAPVVPASVVAAEDARFCRHRGIEWDAMQDAIDDLQAGENGRGGSTITQQLAKNLFLWPGRSVVRKALEAPLALWLDLVLGKRRVLEIYLNTAEMGPSGQFGAESASLYAFGRPASVLSPREAALLATTLPNPALRDIRRPSRGQLRVASIYVARARAAATNRCW